MPAEIVVIESNPALRQSVRLILEAQGFDVVAAASVAEWRRDHDGRRARLVVLDADCATAEIDLAAQLSAVDRSTPVIVCSAVLHGSSGMAQVVSRPRVRAALMKPYIVGSLIEAVHQALEDQEWQGTRSPVRSRARKARGLSPSAR